MGDVGAAAGSLLVSPCAIFSATCRLSALPGDSNPPPVKEFTHPASPGESCGNGENESGETPNGDKACFNDGEKVPNGNGLPVVAVVGAAGAAAMGRSGGGAILCNRELGGFGDEFDAGWEVPVNCCTNERKSLGSVLYTCGANRGCANVGRNPFFILLELLFTANDLFFPDSPPSSIDIGAAIIKNHPYTPTTTLLGLATSTNCTHRTPPRSLKHPITAEGGQKKLRRPKQSSGNEEEVAFSPASSASASSWSPLDQQELLPLESAKENKNLETCNPWLAGWLV